MPATSQNRASNNARKAQQVTLLGMAVDIALGIIKLLVGNLSNSQALIADGIHSLSDAATDLMVVVITRVSHQSPDTNHPYGHARFETMGTLLLGSSLIVIALLLAYHYLELAIMGASTNIPTWPALLVAVLSIVAKEWIFRYTKKTGEALRSNLLIANAWHSRTDAFSSIVVLIGVGGAMLGVAWLDSVAALIVALIILKVGMKLVWNSSKELVDTAVEPEQVEALRRSLLSAEGIVNVHDLRTRRMGQGVFLDVHLQVNPRISVSEGHQLGERAIQQLLRKYRFINDATYHIDVTDDHKASKRNALAELPLRNEISTQLKQSWPDMPAIDCMTLHYLNQQVDIDLIIKPSQSIQLNSTQFAQQLQRLNQDQAWLGKVSVYFKGDQ